MANTAFVGDHGALKIVMKSTDNDYEIELPMTGSSSYANYDVGTYDIEVISTELNTTVAELKQVSFAANRYYMLLVRGSKDNPERGVEVIVE
jgi:hypothetical protein